MFVNGYERKKKNICEDLKKKKQEWNYKEKKKQNHEIPYLFVSIEGRDFNIWQDKKYSCINFLKLEILEEKKSQILLLRFHKKMFLIWIISKSDLVRIEVEGENCQVRKKKTLRQIKRNNILFLSSFLT